MGRAQVVWIGLARRCGGAGDPVRASALRRGTILLETTASAARPATLLRHAARDPSPSGLTLRLGASGLDVFVARDAGSASHHLSLPSLREGEVLRIAQAWDGTVGALSAWLPERGAFFAAPALGPPPPVLGTLSGPDRSADGEGSGWAALSDRWTPSGPPPLLPGDAPVATPSGPRPLAALRAGDAALGPDGRPVPVLWSGRADWPALGGLAPVRLSAPWFGLNRDLVVGAEQALIVRGSAVEYLFGTDTAAIPAGAIGTAVSGPAVRRWHGVFTADSAPILVAGAAMATLDARAVLRSGVTQAISPLAGLRLSPPSPGRPVPLRLTALEAATLARARAA
jgi:hypothetical protein